KTKRTCRRPGLLPTEICPSPLRETGETDLPSADHQGPLSAGGPEGPAPPPKRLAMPAITFDTGLSPGTSLTPRTRTVVPSEKLATRGPEVEMGGGGGSVTWIVREPVWPDMVTSATAPPPTPSMRTRIPTATAVAF